MYSLNKVMSNRGFELTDTGNGYKVYLKPNAVGCICITNYSGTNVPTTLDEPIRIVINGVCSHEFTMREFLIIHRKGGHC